MNSDSISVSKCIALSPLAFPVAFHCVFVCSLHIKAIVNIVSCYVSSEEVFEYANCNMSLAVVKMDKVEPDSYEGEEAGEGEGDAEEGQGAAKGEGEGDYYMQPHDQPEKTYLLFAGYFSIISLTRLQIRIPYFLFPHKTHSVPSLPVTMSSIVTTICDKQTEVISFQPINN